MIAQLWLRGLAWMILAYRRFVSGRGPLRGVRCSFAPDESCSAYGLRAARESHTVREALGKIRRRLHRCRDACLVGDGATLSWTPLHDQRPSEIAATMTADGERPPAIARMLATRRVVAAWTRDAGALRELAPSPYKPSVCLHAGVERRARRRIAIRIAIAAAIAVTLMRHPFVDACAVAAVIAAAIGSIRTFVVHRRRFALHAATPTLSAARR